MAEIDVFDGHNDAVQFIAEYTSSGRDFLSRSESGHLDLPRAREGGLAGGLFALHAGPERQPENDLIITGNGYEVIYAETVDPLHARRQIEAQRLALEILIRRSDGRMRMAVDVEEIAAARAEGAFAVVLHMEGAEAVDGEFDYLHRLHAAGLRSLGPVWSRPNIFGSGVPFAYPRSPDTGPGLTEIGKELVRTCNRLGIMIDLSHLNEKGFWDVAALSHAPLVVTHGCAHAICPSTRNLTDRQLDAIRDSDGVIGFNLSVNDVRADGHLKDDTPLEAVARHIDYLVNRVGEDRVALGSDFDGAVIPRAIKDASGLPLLFDAMRNLGFDTQGLAKFAFDNWLRVFGLTWKNSPSS
ncbi:membrane dipeptidase [Rhizobium leguminosarum]|uniref:Membrane dipeptidase n=1 Tax=Rhizobium leguminosarum TaxID=384 RepID=A0AAE2MGA9_RHILE|nr:MULTISPECIES: dipeptidase [Rhizobium]MBB4288818.1 membrane dipeptidase [Rhizobium leguminosarum]MBB4295089.1 membrane dipeptidase [Rhizobium leguminosarum]MBB4306482.1 membrane dipeptidase [Rhizobium leguminosarum]MBB4417937.1 membrane dipeptidase [Rhizobium leguminosarum]MBB4432782.1 membrane dipeptidase [Rhizobium esperanzae]